MDYTMRGPGQVPCRLYTAILSARELKRMQVQLSHRQVVAVPRHACFAAEIGCVLS